MSPAAVLVKICGLTSASEARAVAEAGAEWIGLNFHPPSPRFVSEETARSIIAALPSTTQAVGLFVNRPVEEVRSIVTLLGIGIVQLHGDEPPEYLRELGDDLTIVRAFRIGNREDVGRMAYYLERCWQLGRVPDAELVDAFVPGQAGGTGRAIDTDVLTQGLPPVVTHLILAGGLTPENVTDRVQRFRPWMVDVASGVESSPGHKDLDRVAAFIRAARSV